MEFILDLFWGFFRGVKTYSELLRKNCTNLSSFGVDGNDNTDTDKDAQEEQNDGNDDNQHKIVAQRTGKHLKFRFIKECSHVSTTKIVIASLPNCKTLCLVF